jgi:hypothetical protein
MTIAARLRRAASLGLIDGGLMEEAADEIERLRAIEGPTAAQERDHLASQCAELLEENKRLRKNDELQMQRAIRAEAEAAALSRSEDRMRDSAAATDQADLSVERDESRR